MYNESPKFSTLKELITQPILLHMVASLEQDITDSINRAAIYTKLFDQLVQRPWSKEGNIEPLRGIQPSLLREALQDMAHAIFHSPKGYLHKSSLKRLTKVNYLQRALDNHLDIWRTVMVAFYIDEVRKDTRSENDEDNKFDYAIEFLHKSLPEYLCAEKIWRTIQEEFIDNKPKKVEHALESIFDIFGEKIISQEVAHFLIQIIENDDAGNKLLLFERLSLFLEDFLMCDFLLQNKTQNPLNTICAAFYGYWTILSSLGQDQNLFKDTFTTERLIRLLKLLSNHSIPYFFNLSKQNLSFTRLAGTNLEGSKFDYANLERVVLNGAILKNANLKGVILKEGNLISANLEGANLRNANLEGANLEGANLGEANLEGAYLKNARLVGARLDGVRLDGARLERANLIGAVLESASLEGTHLTVARLSGAFLKGARLKNAKLEGTRLEGADLEGANLEIAHLKSANLERANLERANLEGANLETTYLERSNLTRANLKNANLKNANLENANLKNTNLEGIKLEGANLEGVSLKGANLKGGNLKYAINLTLVQLQSVHTLYNCTGMPDDLEKQIRQSHPQLFVNPYKT